jgi:KDO2-lipid IV(A) lauroyltransferase
MLKLFVFKLGQFRSDHLSLNVSRTIVKFIFDIKYTFSIKDKKAVINNLTAIMPEGSDISKASKEVFHNFGKYLLEFFLMERMVTDKFVKENVRSENLHILKEVLDRGRGCIMLTAHLGNWEYGAAVMGILSFPMSVVALPHKESAVNEIFDRKREKSGMAVISSRMAYKKCIAALKNNRLIALVGDRDFSPNGETMDFLGKKVMIPQGAAVFAKKTGAAIIPAFLIREGEDRFILSINDPIYVDAAEGLKHNSVEISDIIKQYISVVEKKIREYPTQWMIFREFWS